MHKTTYPLYNSTWDAASKLWKYEGTRGVRISPFRLSTRCTGLWKGFVTCEAGYAFSHTLYFVFYEVAKQRLQSIYSHLTGDESKGHSNMKGTTFSRIHDAHTANSFCNDCSSWWDSRFSLWNCILFIFMMRAKAHHNCTVMQANL